MMHEPEKSDVPIVAVKQPNAAAGSSEAVDGEAVERRGMAEGNAGKAAMPRAQDRAGMSKGLDRVRQAARDRKEERFTSLLHHVDVAALRRAYDGLNRKAAVGVDGVTWQAYGRGLEARLGDLLDRVHRGAYRAQPSRRTYIPKPDGRQRPLGIAALEDKILQSAVAEVLNAIYEADFLGFSYGFRPGRGQHDALDALAYAIDHRKVNYILDADIRSFFDTLSHDWLMTFLERRIGDSRILRLIRKWLRAGVLEDGVWSDSPQGTPQGAVISPLLANVYLHTVIDCWAEAWRAKADGEVIIVRYADDLIVGFQHRSTAERFLAQMRQRLQQHGLDLHPDKTRLIEFGRYAAERRGKRGEGRPETFDFLGFTHIASTDRRGAFQLKRVTRRTRMRDRLRAIKEGLTRRRHSPIAEQGRWLGQVVRGYFAYHAVPTNQPKLWGFLGQVRYLWLKALRRRSQKDCTTWERFGRLAKHWLPPVAVLHPWPSDRFRRHHPRWEPGAGKPHAGFCAGGAG
jgi:RNA-directed DNA polymerase